MEFMNARRPSMIAFFTSAYLRRLLAFFVVFLAAGSVRAQYEFNGKPLTDDEILRLKREIPLSKGKDKFDKILRLVYHLYWRYDVQDSVEITEYIFEAGRLAESSGSDPYYKIRLLWLETFNWRSPSYEAGENIVGLYANADPKRLQREDTIILASAVYLLGHRLSKHSHRDSLLKSVKLQYQALRMYVAIGDSARAGNQYGTIGALHLSMHNYEDAAKNTLLAIRYFDDNKSAALSLRNNLGLIYMAQKKYKEALETFERVVQGYREINKENYHELAVALGLSQFITNAAMTALNLKDQGALSKYVRELREWLDKYPSDYYSVYLALFEMGEAGLRNNDELAEQKYRRLREILPQGKAWRAASVAAMLAGKRDLEKRRHLYAVAAFRRALSYPELPHKIYLEEIYRSAADAYLALQRYDSAYFFIRQELELRDSIEQVAEVYRSLDFLHRYESDKLKESLQAATLENERRRWENRWAWGTALLVGGVVLVLIPLSWALWRTQKRIKRINSKLRRRNETIDRQKMEIEVQAAALQTALDAKERLDQFKENMMQLVVHDLKSPLNVVLGFADMSTDATTKKYVSSAGQKMLTLVLTLLDVSRFETDTLKPQWANVLLGEAIASAREHILLELETKKIRFETAGLDAVVRADRQLLYRILVNMLTNAVKYTPPGGKISVSAAVENGRTRVSVGDTGPGIPEEFIPQLFERFTSSSAKSLGRTPSTGLGLYFCKLAVEAHGGSIRVDSRPGEGTTFAFDLEFVSIGETPTTVSEPKDKDSTLNPEAFKAVAPFIQKLAKMEVYETTSILSILDEMPTDGAEIERWKAEVRNAAFACNAEAYARRVKSSPSPNAA